MDHPARRGQSGHVRSGVLAGGEGHPHTLPRCAVGGAVRSGQAVAGQRCVKSALLRGPAYW
eukprot:25634-Eustigmatos_ZCMA.PRE.1